MTRPKRKLPARRPWWVFKLGTSRYSGVERLCVLPTMYEAQKHAWDLNMRFYPQYLYWAAPARDAPEGTEQ